MVITVIANRRGLVDAAAVGIVEKIIGVLFLVPSAMLSTVSAMAAQNIGAGKIDRAESTLVYAVCIAVFFGTVSAVILQFFASGAVGFFTDGDRGYSLRQPVSERVCLGLCIRRRALLFQRLFLCLRPVDDFLCA